MATKAYRITIDADFIAKASSPSVVRHRLDRLLRENHFEQKDFTYGIEPIKEPQLVGNRA